MKNNWIEAIYQLDQQGSAYVLITLVGVKGSTPRDGGTKMVVDEEHAFDTIGGGHLEHKCIAFARKMLADKQQGQFIENFQLGAKLGQCCGGQTSVLFEYFAASSVNITLFGAGHVGQALVNILAELPCKVTWVDAREEQFPASAYLSGLTNVTCVVSDSPTQMVDKADDDSYFVVMTHNHQLDFDICQRILQRKPFAYLGLIASKTKWRRFEQRFAHRDIDPKLVAQMNCPIGLAQIPGKKPSEIAVSVAGKIIETYQQKAQQQNNSEDAIKAPSVPWQELKLLLTETQ